MAIIRNAVIAACLLTTLAASAQEAARPAVPDVVYKGLIGKALDAVPMDPDKRVVLQRTNAVVSNTVTARSLAVWAGLANPVMLVAGVAWGIYAAVNIKSPEADTAPETNRMEPATREPAQLARLTMPSPRRDSTDLSCLSCAIRTDSSAGADADGYHPDVAAGVWSVPVIGDTVASRHD